MTDTGARAMNAAELQYLPVPVGKPVTCPHCGVLVLLSVDAYGCAKQRGGCKHIGAIEQLDGALRVGFFAESAE